LALVSVMAAGLVVGVTGSAASPVPGPRRSHVAVAVALGDSGP